MDILLVRKSEFWLIENLCDSNCLSGLFVVGAVTFGMGQTPGSMGYCPDFDCCYSQIDWVSCWFVFDYC